MLFVVSMEIYSRGYMVLISQFSYNTRIIIAIRPLWCDQCTRDLQACQRVPVKLLWVGVYIHCFGTCGLASCYDIPPIGKKEMGKEPMLIIVSMEIYTIKRCVWVGMCVHYFNGVCMLM